VIGSVGLTAAHIKYNATQTAAEASCSHEAQLVKVRNAAYHGETLTGADVPVEAQFCLRRQDTMIDRFLGVEARQLRRIFDIVGGQMYIAVHTRLCRRVCNYRKQDLGKRHPQHLLYLMRTFMVIDSSTVLVLGSTKTKRFRIVVYCCDALARLSFIFPTM